jgi:ribosomal protein L40E
MSMHNDPYPVGQVAGPTPNGSRNSVVFWVLLIAGGASLLFVACAGLCGASVYFGTQSVGVASARVDEFFAANAQKRFAALYDTEVSTQYRTISSREKHIEFGEMIEKHLGPLKSKTMQNFHSGSFNGRSQVTVVYNATFEKGNGTIHAKLVWQGGGWKFEEVRVQSHLFDKTVACATCGAKHPVTAKFCPSCGKPVAEAK